MSDFNDWNAKIIKEFRENGGVVDSYFAPTRLVLLHTTGSKSGKERINPLMYGKLDEGNGYYIIASAGGADSHPDWYHNLLANPMVEAEIGTERFQARATVADEPERSELYGRMAAEFDFFAKYAAKTKDMRTIPVVKLEPLS